jgi:hypothetical protein
MWSKAAVLRARKKLNWDPATAGSRYLATKLQKYRAAAPHRWSTWANTFKSIMDIQPGIICFEEAFAGPLKELARRCEELTFRRKHGAWERAQAPLRNDWNHKRSVLKNRVKAHERQERFLSQEERAELEAAIASAEAAMNAEPEPVRPAPPDLNTKVGLADWIPIVGAGGKIRYRFSPDRLPVQFEEADDDAQGGAEEAREAAAAAARDRRPRFDVHDFLKGAGNAEADMAAIAGRLDHEVYYDVAMQGAEAALNDVDDVAGLEREEGFGGPPLEADGKPPVEWVLEVDRIPERLHQLDYRKRMFAYHNVFGRVDFIMRMTQESEPGQIRYGLSYLNSSSEIFRRPEIVADFPEACQRLLAKADWLEHKHPDSYLLMGMASVFSLDGYTLRGVDEEDEASFLGQSEFFRRQGYGSLEWKREHFASVPGLAAATPPPARAPPPPRPRRPSEFEADDVFVPGYGDLPPPSAAPPPSLHVGSPNLKEQLELFWHKKKIGHFRRWDPSGGRDGTGGWVFPVDTLDYWTSEEAWDETPDLAFVALFVILRDCTSVDVERVFSKLRHLAGIYRGATLTQRLLREALISMFPDLWREIHCGRPQE